MPAVARKDSTDTVNTVHVSVGDADPDDGIACDAAPTNTSTNEGSTTVFANRIGVVRKDDKVTAHTIPGCSTHEPGLTAYSGNVFADNKNIGRKNDTYGCGAKITTGSPNVYANGT